MQTLTLSAEALALLKRHITQDGIMVDDTNREAHRELAKAGIMYPLSGFASGSESHYRFTEAGWNGRHQWLNESGHP